jgi:hypothetical protein
MRRLILIVLFSLCATTAQAATLTYSFEATQTFANDPDDGVSGIVDALRPFATITGTITFDLTVQNTFPDATPPFTSYGPPVVSVDGFDLSGANARTLGLAVRGTTDEISSGTRPFTPGEPESNADQVTFFAFSSDPNFIGDDNAFPRPFAPIPSGATYQLTFITSSWDGPDFFSFDFTGSEGVTYTINDIAPVPLPAPALLLAGGLAGLIALRRRAA